MGRLIFPRLDGSVPGQQPAYQRPPTVAPDGMNHYTVRDAAQAYGLASQIGSDFVRPAGDALVMAAQRRATGATQDNFDVNNPDTYGPDPRTWRTEPDGSPMSSDGPLFKPYQSQRTGNPIIVQGPVRGAPPMFAQGQDPSQGASPTDQAPLEGARSQMAAQPAPQPIPAQQPVDTSFQEQIPEGFPRANIPQPTGPQAQQPMGAADYLQAMQRPREQYQLNVNPARVHSLNELHTLVGAAHRTNRPEDLDHVANAIDRADFGEVAPRSWTDWFTGAHKEEARRNLKDKLFAQAGNSQGNDLRLQTLEQRAIMDAIRAPGIAAGGEKKQVQAGYEDQNQQLAAAKKALDIGLAQIGIMKGSADAKKRQFEALLAGIKANHGEEAVTAAIELQRAQAGNQRAQAGLADAKTVETNTLLEPRAHELGTRANMQDRMPAAGTNIGGTGATRPEAERLAKEIRDLVKQRAAAMQAEGDADARSRKLPSTRDARGREKPELVSAYNAAKKDVTNVLERARRDRAAAERALKATGQSWRQAGLPDEQLKALLEDVSGAVGN